MKTFVILSVFCSVLFYFGSLFSQEIIHVNHEVIPQDLQLKDDLQNYQVITTHVNSDLFGNFLNKMQVKGEYTRGLPDGMVKWNNVTVAMSMQSATDFSAGEQLEFMENYTYIPSADMMNEKNFKSFSHHSAFAKNLIWDMMGIEGLAWANLKNLELNKPFSAADFNEKIDIAGQGFFENRNMMLTWTGRSEWNNELCAVIQYQTYNNPLLYDGEDLLMKGLSHYWGNIWVSLEDMQIEHATMFEVVTAEMKFNGQPDSQVMSITRNIEIIKKK